MPPMAKDTLIGMRAQIRPQAMPNQGACSVRLQSKARATIEAASARELVTMASAGNPTPGSRALSPAINSV